MIKEIIEAYKDRVRSRIFFPFVISFIFYHWPLSLVLMKSSDWQASYNFISNYISTRNLFSIVGIPIGMAFIASLGFPTLSAISEAIVSQIDRFSRISRLKAEHGLAGRRIEIEKLNSAADTVKSGRLKDDHGIFLKFNGILNNREMSIIRGNQGLNSREFGLLDVYESLMDIFRYQDRALNEAHVLFFHEFKATASANDSVNGGERRLGVAELNILADSYQRYRLEVQKALGIPTDA